MTKSPRIHILTTPIDKLSLDETVQEIDQRMVNGEQLVHACINAANTVLIHEDRHAWESITAADIISADGQAVVWASRLLGQPLPERVPGPDLMNSLMNLANSKGYKVYLLGAEEEIVSRVADLFSSKYGKEIVAGFHHGYFSAAEEEVLVADINASGADMLFVAIPSPKKELFNEKYRKQLKNVGLIMGVGGTFDVISGKVKRAPRWMQDNGLEWLYRLIIEPRRMWRRYLIGNFKFIRIVLKEYIKGK